MDLITEDSSEPPMPPPPPETILVGRSPVRPATSMRGIYSRTTLYGGEVLYRYSARIPITALGGQEAPPPAVAISSGHSPVGPATITAVQGIPATSVQGIPGSTTLSAGGVAPNDPSSSVNANPDRALEVIADPADGDTAAGRMLRISRELMRTAILDPALAALAKFLLKALDDGNMERAYCIVFMAAILFLLRKYYI